MYVGLSAKHSGELTVPKVNQVELGCPKGAAIPVQRRQVRRECLLDRLAFKPFCILRGYRPSAPKGAIDTAPA